MAAVTEVKVPNIGDFEDVPIVTVFVEPGATIALEDPLVEIESDKATMEVPSPVAGTVKEVKVAVGDKVSEGTLVALVEPEGDGGGEARPDVDPQQQAEPRDEPAAQRDEPEPDEPEPEPDAGRGGAAPALEEGATDDGGAHGSGADVPQPPATADGEAPYASPVARRAARELGVDLSSVQGSGRKGRILREDVEAAAAGGAQAERRTAPAAPAAGLDLAPWPQVDFAKYGEIEREPISRIGKIAARNLARNWVHIPHVTQFDEADITGLEAFRKELNAEQDDVKVTMVALLLKACAATLQAFPRFNASLDGEELVLKKHYHLGFAADTPNGLVVPVIRDVDRKGILALAAELADLSGRARAGKLGPGEMAGGTFTISSLGGIGGTAFTPIINAPEVAILGVSRSVTKPVWDGAAFVPRLMLPLSLSYDHRVIDGAAAARFTVHLGRVLGDLRRVLL